MKHLFLQISSKQDPTLVSVVFKKSDITHVREFANKLWALNPTAYYMDITDGAKVLFVRKL